MSNIGRTIKDGYCNGYFGRNYTLSGSVIIAEGDEYIVIRDQSGIVHFANLQDWDWEKGEDGYYTDTIRDLKCMSESERNELIESWCLDKVF
jgi:hypothetical protein